MFSVTKQQHIQSLTEELKSQGVIFTDIQTAAKEHSDLVAEVLHERRS